jgi:hypothetical protein
MTDQADTGSREAQPITYHEVSRLYGPGTIGARERYGELSMREHLARAYTTLWARGEYDPAKHGAGDSEPLTAEEHLELLALGEYLARSYKPSFEVDHALRAGATWAQVAEALDADADDDGRGAHWLAPGQKCTRGAGTAAEGDAQR